MALHEEGQYGLELQARLPGFLREPIRVYRVPHPMLRAYVVSGAVVASGSDAIRALLDPGFDPERQLILDSGVPADADPSFVGRARVTLRRSDAVRVEAESSGDGYLVLLDGYDPGWRSLVDGKDAPVLCANCVFRAVRLTAGKHQIEFRYRSVPLLWGLAASVLAFAVLTSLWVGAWLRVAR